MRFKFKPPRFASLKAGFLAINVPLMLLAMLILFGLYEYTAYNRAHQELVDKLERIVENQSTVLSESLWTLDRERIALIVAAASADPDIRGAAVYDDMGNLLSRTGDLDDAGRPELRAERNIVFASRGSAETIGTLVVTLTDRRIAAAAQERLVWAVALAAGLLLAVVISALVANRWTIGIPLQRLLDSIDRTESGGVRHAVQWDSRDEVGAVVQAFNRMQARQQRYEAELRRAYDHLERRVAERTAELAKARDAAEAANKAKTGFLANMSHELRTPLNAIIGFSEVLEGQIMGELGNPRYRDYARDIRESGLHLLALINDLLDLSKAEAGKLELNEVMMDLRDAIEQSMAMVQPRANEAGIALYHRLPQNLPFLYADDRKIKQVLLNLLTNAVKFTPSGGEAFIEVIENGTQLNLVVADTGIGIAEADLERVVEPFAQVDNSLSRKHEGTGLGLPLVKSLVELHGGELAIDSELGRGTRVTFSLPQDRLIHSPFAQPAASTRAVS